MDITISVSDRVIGNIQERANGKPIEDFVEEFVEESFAIGHQFSDEEGERRHNNLMRMAGMFSSGRTDTSARMREILYSEDLDPAQGFGTDK